MSDKYKLMIYFAVATMHLYSKDIEIYEGMPVHEFKNKNRDLLDRVFEEGKNIFKYELSGHQMDRAVYAYASGKLNPQSVKDTEAYVLEDA